MRKFLCLSCVALALCSGAEAQNTPVRNLAPTGDTGPLVAAVENTRLYPVFVLPLGSGFYDFELKASTTNYVTGILVYFLASAGTTNTSLAPYEDLAANIFLTIPSATEPRRWVSSTFGHSLYGQIGSSRVNQVVVMPSKIPGSSGWMFRGNPNLVWSYLRITATGPETDAAGHTVWNPVVPVDWRANRTSP